MSNDISCEQERISFYLDELSEQMDSILESLEDNSEREPYTKISIEGKSCEKCGNKATQVNFAVVLCDNCKV